MFFKKKEIPKRPELSLGHEIILHKLGHIKLNQLTDEALKELINMSFSELVKKV